MKKRMVQIGIVVILIGFFIVFMQIKDSHKSLPVNHSNRPTQYSLSDIIQVFNKHHIKLNPVTETKDASFELNKVHPHIYSIHGDKKRVFLIFVFDSVADRQKAEEPLKQEFKSIFPAGTYPLGFYETWNILIEELSKLPVKPAEFVDIKQTKLDQIVFKDLNHGKVKTYKGESKNWKGTYTLKYYRHHWVNKEGLDVNDNYGDGQFVIHYKPKTSIQNIECEFKNGSGSLKTSVNNLDEKGNITIDVYNTDVVNPSKPRTITLKINNTVETITFKEK